MGEDAAQLGGPHDDSGASHRFRVLLLWAAFPAGSVIAESRVEIEQRRPTGGRRPEPTRTRSGGELQRRACPPTALTLSGLLSSHDLLLNVCISIYLGPCSMLPTGS